MFSFSLTSPYASGSPPNYIRRSFEISTDHRRVFIDGVSYDYAVVAHYQVEWPVRLSTRGAMFFYTNLCARQNEVDLRFLPRRFVCLVDGTISELGITGDPIGSNYGNLVFPVWLRRCKRVGGPHDPHTSRRYHNTQEFRQASQPLRNALLLLNLRLPCSLFHQNDFSAKAVLVHAVKQSTNRLSGQRSPSEITDIRSNACVQSS